MKKFGQKMCDLNISFKKVHKAFEVTLTQWGFRKELIHEQAFHLSTRVVYYPSPMLARGLQDGHMNNTLIH